MTTPVAEAQIEVQEPRAEASRQKDSRQRFLPLDAFRGLIMIVLVSEGLGFASLSQYPRYHAIAVQFDHVNWVGTVFWDLILPAFMFMVGMSMPYSLGSRTEQGKTFRQDLQHVAIRSLRLMVLSQILISIEANKLHFQMHNILTHIAVVYFFCFLIMQLKFSYQVVTATVLLVGYSSVFFSFPGPDGAFSKTGNITAVIDRILMGYNYESWTTNLNVITQTVIALFGVWTGNLLHSGRSGSSQLRILALATTGAFALGLGLSPFIPIIPKIVTASFVFYSTGWILLMFLFLYLIIEVAGYRRLVFPLTVVGSNAIFIYSIGEILHNRSWVDDSPGWLDRSVAVFTGNFGFLGTLAPVAQSCAVLLVMWYLCYWLYKRKIFLRL